MQLLLYHMNCVGWACTASAYGGGGPTCADEIVSVRPIP